MFEINQNPTIKEKTIEGTKIYFIDKFYANPDEIVEYFLTTETPLWKNFESPSLNGIYFEDRRHLIHSDEIIKVYKFLENLCGSKPNKENLITTNLTRFKKSDFNDYENNYWWPHRDTGYNGIVYLNKDNSSSGTNFYKNLDPLNEPPKCPEHYLPWRPKTKYELITTIESQYNQLVLFDGSKILHGMNICNNDYFSNTYRLNQAFFFR